MKHYLMSLIVTLVMASVTLGQDTPPSFVILETKVISPVDQYNQHLYYGWPTVGIDAGGQLFAVASGGRDEHVCPFGRVDFLRSHDGGETWTWPQTALDGPIDDRDAGIVITPNGTIIMTTFTSLAYEQSLKAAIANQNAGQPNFSDTKLKNWLAVHTRISSEERNNALGNWAVRSTDNGVNWSQRIDTIVNSPHGPTVLDDGRLLYVGKTLWGKPERCGVAESTDDGKTWQWVAELPTRDGDSVEQYHEWHAVQTSSGKIVAQVRNHNPANNNETLQCESDDGGKTWTKPHPIGVWGHPSHMTRLQDGRILMSYGHRRAPLGNQVRMSADEGQTWSEPIIVSGDGISGDLGYPSTVQLQDGTLVTLWYEKMQDYPKCVLRIAKWKLLDE